MSHFDDAWTYTELDDWADALPTLDWTANAIMALLQDVEIEYQGSEEETSQSETESTEHDEPSQSESESSEEGLRSENEHSEGDTFRARVYTQKKILGNEALQNPRMIRQNPQVCHLSKKRMCRILA